MFQNNKAAAMLVNQTNPLGVEFLSYTSRSAKKKQGHSCSCLMYITTRYVCIPVQIPVHKIQSASSSHRVKVDKRRRYTDVIGLKPTSAINFTLSSVLFENPNKTLPLVFENRVIFSGFFVYLSNVLVAITKTKQQVW